MAVDATGRVHVLLSHLPDAQAYSNFDNARTKSQYFHYFREAAGTWSRSAMTFRRNSVPRKTGDRRERQRVRGVAGHARGCCLGCTRLQTVGAALETTTPASTSRIRLIDTARLASEDKLSIFYPRKNSSDIYVLDYQIVSPARPRR